MKAKCFRNGKQRPLLFGQGSESEREQTAASLSPFVVTIVEKLQNDKSVIMIVIS